MIHQILFDFGADVWQAFYTNYKLVLWMIAGAFVLHAIPDELADKVIGRFQKIPLLGYIVIFFLFVVVYGFFKSSEQVLPIYLKF